MSSKNKKPVEEKASEVSQVEHQLAESHDALPESNVVDSPMDDVVEQPKSSDEESLVEGDVIASDEETVELSLRVKNNHPALRYNVLDLVISGNQFKKYHLTEKQFIDLLGAGPRTYIECEDMDLNQAAEEYKAKLASGKKVSI